MSVELARPGGKPVIEVPGLKEMPPRITVLPVLVMVLAAQTPCLAAVEPRTKASVTLRARKSPQMVETGKSILRWLVRS